jgi:hypothetical protein
LYIGLPIPAKGSRFTFEEHPTRDKTDNNNAIPAINAAIERNALLIYFHQGLSKNPSPRGFITLNRGKRRVVIYG